MIVFGWKAGDLLEKPRQLLEKDRGLFMHA